MELSSEETETEHFCKSGVCLGRNACLVHSISEVNSSEHSRIGHIIDYVPEIFILDNDIWCIRIRYEGEPTFAPNGETIAYVADESGNLDIYLKQISGGADINLTNNPADDVQPAPANRPVSFLQP